MKKLIFTSLVCTALSSVAQTEINISTGVVNGSTNLIASGSSDDSWVMNTPSGITPKVVNPVPGWAYNSCSKWITPYASGTEGAVAPLGDYIFEFNFNLNITACVESATIDIESLGGDDDLYGIQVNNNTPTPFYTHFNPLTGPHSIDITSQLNLTGSNKLKIYVSNDGPSSATGLNVCGKIRIWDKPAIVAAYGTNICPSIPVINLELTHYPSGASIQWQKQECTMPTWYNAGSGPSLTLSNGNQQGTTYRAKTTCNGIVSYSNSVIVYKFPSSCSGPILSCNAPGGGGLGGGRYKAEDAAEELEKVIAVYPNPFNNDFKISCNGEWDYTVEVHDVLGKMYAQQQGVANQEIQIEMGNAPVGLYIVKVTTAQGTIFKKVTKE